MASRSAREAAMPAGRSGSPPPDGRSWAIPVVDGASPSQSSRIEDAVVLQGIEQPGTFIVGDSGGRGEH